MEKNVYQGIPGDKAEGKPYEYLFIYLLEGYLEPEDEKNLGGHFLGNWIEGNQSFLFFSGPSGEIITNLLDDRQNLRLVDEYRFTYEEWQGGMPEEIKVGPFIIVSPWAGPGTEHEGLKIILDPGVVFGNGLHPTTRDCLKALSQAHKYGPLGKVLDLGTGTGVLSIAAARLGAEAVLAADLNPLCVKTARRNVELNELGHIIQIRESEAEDLADEPADLVMTNIHHAVIKSLIAQRRFKEGERLILSGLMRSQFREIEAQLKSGGFKLLKTWDHEMVWFTMLGAKIDA